MKLHVMSDLHLDYHRDRGQTFLDSLEEHDDEVLVLAGDIYGCDPVNQARFEEIVQQFCSKYSHVVFVPGNHEFHDTSIANGQQFLISVEARNPNFKFLRTGTVVTIDGRRFLGDTMWYPDHPMNAGYARRFIDFKRISDSHAIYGENARFRTFMRTECKPGDIVITHHLPSTQSIATQYIGDQFNRFFLSDMTYEMYHGKPVLWIHGHTHHQFDYQQFDTRVIANPRGHAGEDTFKNWDPRKVIDV